MRALTRLTNDAVTARTTVLTTSDGAADVYGLDTAGGGLMVNHVSGEAIWDVLFTTATEARLTILAPGSPDCVPQPGLLDHLPADIRPNARVVSSGHELSQAIIS
jgi:hypothetical protein